MKASTLQNQRGAVLVFSLVMLLLLTLASTTMIQQNKAQISVAANIGQQVTTFTSVETALIATQDILSAKRYYSAPYPPNTAAAKHCKRGTTDSVHENNILTSTGSPFSASVRAVYCISNYDPIAGGGNEYRCLYKPDGTRNTTVGSVVAADPSANPPVAAVPTTDEVDACNRLTAAGWLSPTGGAVPNTNYCQIEAYTVDVTLDDATTGNKRTVESKFQVDCSGDRNG